MRKKACYQMRVQDADTSTNEVVEMWAFSAEGARMMARDAGFAEVLSVRKTMKPSAETLMRLWLFAAVVVTIVVAGLIQNAVRDGNQVEKRYPPGHPQHVAP